MSTAVSTARVLPRVMHVGKYFPPYRGGIESHLQILCSKLRNDVKLEVVVSNDAIRTVEEVFDGLKVKRLGRLLSIAAAPVCPSMLRAMQNSDADIVHIHLPNPLALLAYLVSGHRGRLILSYHSDVIRQKHLNSLYEPLLKRCMERSSALIVATARYMESSPVLGPFQSRCRVIPYGIDLEYYDEVEREAVRAIRMEYGQNLVLAVGRLVYYKGFEYLIRAIKKVDAHLLILGNGPFRARLEDLTDRISARSQVTFLDGVKDLRPYYHAASLFVLPSIARSEAFGIVQLEAMACRIPVVNTDLDSGVPWISRHGETGFTVPPGDSGALAQAMETLLSNPSLCKELGMAGRRRAEVEFSSEVMRQRMLDLYYEVLARPVA